MAAADPLPEAARNRLLRRADWRFLLDQAQPRRSLCLAGGALAQAVAAISAEVVGPGEGKRVDCDLAVAVNPSHAALGAAWRALRPGGSLYVEWSRPVPGGAAAVRQRLKAAGFSGVACYWPWPGRASALFWLPLEAPQALNYFLTTRPRAHSAWQRAQDALLRRLWRAARRAGLLFPLCATARRPGPSGEEPGGGLLEALRAGWSGWGLGPAPRHLSQLLLTGGRSSLNKVASLIFADASLAPALVVKQARVPEALPGLRREAANLRAVAASKTRGLAGIPRLVFFEDAACRTALGETVLQGEPLVKVLRRDNFRELALRAARWLAELAGRGPAQPRDAWWPRLVEAPLAEFARRFGGVVEAAQLDQTRAALNTLPDLPLVIEQRDCSPWNLLVGDDGTLAVLDWESAEVRGLPALDLVYFLTYLAFFVDGAMDSGRFREAYRAALSPETFTGAVVAESQAVYVAQVGIDPGVLRPLRLLAWLLHSRSEHERLAADGPQPMAADALRRSLFLALWEEELRCNTDLGLETGRG